MPYDPDCGHLGRIAIEVGRGGKARARFWVSDLAEEAHPIAKRTLKEHGYKINDLKSAYEGPSWKLADLIRHLRNDGFRPGVGITVAYEMARLAAASKDPSAEARANGRLDAAE